GNSNTTAFLHVDDFQLIADHTVEVPVFANLLALKTDKQVAEPVIDELEKTITIHVPFGTDVTRILVDATISENATMTPASGTWVDLSTPVQLVITNGDL